MNTLGPNDVVRVGEQLKTSDCNCPTATAAPAPAPASAPAPGPATYGTAPATPQPAAPAFTQPAPAPAPRVQPTGVPVNGGLPVYTPPAETGQPAPSINNNPNFGQVVPNATAPPTATMGTLESRGQTAPATRNPSTFGSSPAPVPSTAPAPAPATYGGSPATPGTYGTPVGLPGATTPAAQPSNRAFHIVQEGETPYAIARRYGLTTARLRELNGLKPTDVIVPFQKLYVN